MNNFEISSSEEHGIKVESVDFNMKIIRYKDRYDNVRTLDFCVLEGEDIIVYFKTDSNGFVISLNFNFGDNFIDSDFFEKDKLLMDMYERYTSDNKFNRERISEVINIFLKLINNDYNLDLFKSTVEIRERRKNERAWDN